MVDNDKVFAVYALSLAAGVGTLITFAVGTGIAALPGALSIAEHLGLAFLIRGAYKSFGGFHWSDWSVVSLGGLTPTTTEVEAGANA